MLNIHEIFCSIQGEGYDTGIPCIFVRLFGCNLKCEYCDQPQETKNRKKMSVTSIINEIKKLRVKNICITGGEPLIQPEIYSLLYELVGNGYNISIETNGAVKIDEPLGGIRSYKYVMDIKCPSSGESSRNIFNNLATLLPQDEVKFVIADREDYEYMKATLKKYPTKAKVLLSPMFDPNLKQTIGQDLSDWLIHDSIHENLNARIQIQLHKVIGVL